MQNAVALLKINTKSSTQIAGNDISGVQTFPRDFKQRVLKSPELTL